MHPEFFSEFPSYVSHIRLVNMLAENIDCYNVCKVDQELVRYICRINSLSSTIPPFDPVRFAENLSMIVSYDDFGSDSKTFGHLYPPHFYNLNPSDYFKISVNNKMKERERRFTVAHEIAERLVGFDKKGENPVSHTMFNIKHKERACEKIAREILIPSQSISDAFRTRECGVSLENIRRLADAYEVPLSQMAIKTTYDLKILNAALFSKEDGLYGREDVLIKKPIPVCQLDCQDCAEKISKIRRARVSDALTEIENNKSMNGVIIEFWTEKPLPASEHFYWIAYEEKKI